MKTFLSMIGVLAVSGLLSGCIYESALESKPTQAVDARYVGNWRKVDAADDRLLIRGFDEKQYAVVMEDEKSIQCYRAFTSDLDGLRLASVQTLAPGEAATGKWAFFEYRLDDAERLVVRMINDKVISPGLKSPEELRRAIQDNREHPELFLEEIVYVRVPPAGSQ